MSAGKGTGPDKGVDWKKQRDGWNRIYGKKKKVKRFVRDPNRVLRPGPVSEEGRKEYIELLEESL